MGDIQLRRYDKQSAFFRKQIRIVEWLKNRKTKLLSTFIINKLENETGCYPFFFTLLHFLLNTTSVLLLFFI